MDQEKELSDSLQKVNDSIKFVKYNNMRVIKVEKGSAEGEMLVTENSMNRFGTIHGGALFTLADVTAAVAAMSYGTACVTLSGSINYFRASAAGKIRSYAHETSRTRRTGMYEVELKDEEGLVAKASFTYYDTGKQLSEV